MSLEIYKPQAYTDEIHSEHIDTVLLDPDSRRLDTVRRGWSFVLECATSDGDRRFFSTIGADARCTSELNGVLAYGEMFITQDPGGYELARDVDGAGNISREYEPCRFSRWAEVEDTGVFVRFSESRSARHGRKLLRSPVTDGIAIESTTKPGSASPLHAHTMFVVRNAYVAQESWQETRDARAFDLSVCVESPLSAGPLYGGYPNPVPREDEERVDLSWNAFNTLAGISK